MRGEEGGRREGRKGDEGGMEEGGKEGWSNSQGRKEGMKVRGIKVMERYKEQ